jgi:hypothetical protein
MVPKSVNLYSASVTRLDKNERVEELIDEDTRCRGGATPGLGGAWAPPRPGVSPKKKN